MRRTRRFWGFSAVITAAAALTLLTTFASAASSAGAQHVRWDIISTTGIPPAPINPGGHASATAPDGDTITLTGSGHFVAPANGGGSSGASGGGTWTTTSGGSGTYTVTALVSWQFANHRGMSRPRRPAGHLRGHRNDEGLQDVLHGPDARGRRRCRPHPLPRGVVVPTIDLGQGSHRGCPVR